MNKEEILARSRQENQDGDERERTLSMKAKAAGAIGMAIMFVILVCVKMARGQNVYDLLALYFSFFAASDIFQYRLIKEKKYLGTAACYTFAAIVFMIIYIWWG